MLQVNGEVKLVPQCCSDLLAVHDWEELVNDYKGNFWQGHPEPKITVEGDIITFNLEQQFFPALADKVVVVNRLLLKEALAQAKEELNIFAARLAAVEKEERLGVAGIEKILVG